MAQRLKREEKPQPKRSASVPPKIPASQPAWHGNPEFHVFTFSSPAAALELQILFGIIKGSDDDEQFRSFRERTLILEAANVPARDLGGKDHELSGLAGKWLLLMPRDVVPPLKRWGVWSRCRLVADVDMSIDPADMHAPHKRMADLVLNYISDNWGELSGD